MLKLDPNQTFEATVVINKRNLQASFGIVCRLLDTEELARLQKMWLGEPAVPAREATETEPAREAKPAVPATLTNGEFINHFLVGFAPDVVGADDKPLPFTPENVHRVLKLSGAVKAVIDAFFKGYEEAEEKNSEPPPAGYSAAAAGTQQQPGLT